MRAQESKIAAAQLTYKEIEETLKKKRIEYNLIGLIGYIPAFLLLCISTMSSELIGIPMFFKSMGIAGTTFYLANKKKYYVTDELKNKHENLEKLKDDSEQLKEDVIHFIKKRKEALERKAEQLERNRKLQEYQRLRQEIIAKQEQLEKLEREMNGEEKMNAFVPDTPSFLRREIETKYRNNSKKLAEKRANKNRFNDNVPDYLKNSRGR